MKLALGRSASGAAACAPVGAGSGVGAIGDAAGTRQSSPRMTRLRGAGRVEEAEAAAALMEDAARGERVAAALRCSLAAARRMAD